MSYKTLIMNMGSTSTKVAVYEDENLVWKEVIEHPREEITKFLKYMDQYDYRRGEIMKKLKAHGEELSGFSAFVSRGGTIRPVPGGTWYITDKMLYDSQSGVYGDHPCNIGGQIAYDMAKENGVCALTVDPPICNEQIPEAAYSGLPGIVRLASFQALNHRAIARKFAADVKTPYEELNIIVAHLGGGISVAAHEKGKIIDVNNALAGDGPFAMERSGGLPVGSLIELCYSNKYSCEELLRLVNGRGGVYAYLGIADGRKIDEMISSGDKKAEEVIKAMAYQTSKEIAALGAAFKGKVDAIVLTAGLAHWKYLTDLIADRVSYLAPLHIYPGENEMESLAIGAYRVLSGAENPKNYDELYTSDKA